MGEYPEIHTISVGFAGGGESHSARKSYAREMKEALIYTVRRPPKVRKFVRTVITFSAEDYEGVLLPHNDALVVTMAIANHNIHRILVDTGSSANMLYKSTFDLMRIDRGKLIPVRYPLVGFSGEQVMPIGAIELQVTAGTPPRQKTIMVKFLVIDATSAYNAILGRVA